MTLFQTNLENLNLTIQKAKNNIFFKKIKLYLQSQRSWLLNDTSYKTAEK